MHQSSVLRMQWFIQTYLSNLTTMESPYRGCSENISKISVLDVGSYDVNGTYKILFDANRFDYSGLDMEAGPNVDIVVENPYDWVTVSDESFDVVISGQAFEHIEFFWLTLYEMLRVLKSDGLICIIAPREALRHRHPFDTYRFDTDGMIALAKYGNLTTLHASTNLAYPGAPRIIYSPDADSMLVAKKPADWPGMLNPKEYQTVLNDLSVYATGFVPYEEQKYTWLNLEILSTLCDKKVVVFGAGKTSEKVINKIKNIIHISYLLDNNNDKQGKSLCGFEIKTSRELMSEDKDRLVVLIAVQNRSDKVHIESQLYGLGVKTIFFHDSLLNG